jgi:hypothetical protein
VTKSSFKHKKPEAYAFRLFFINLSCPEIAIKSILEKHEETLGCEANSKDYSMSFNYNLFKKLNEDNLPLQEWQEVWYSK